MPLEGDCEGLGVSCRGVIRGHPIPSSGSKGQGSSHTVPFPVLLWGTSPAPHEPHFSEQDPRLSG